MSNNVYIGGQIVPQPTLGAALAFSYGNGAQMAGETALMAVTITVKAASGSGRVFVQAAMSCLSNGGGTILSTWLYCDSLSNQIYCGDFAYNQNSIAMTPGSMHGIFTGLSAGSHTFGIACWDQNVLATWSGNDSASVTAFELP